MTRTPSHVLVVDDDARLRELLKAARELDGYQVDTAANGEYVLASSRRHHVGYHRP
jgi:DNA-binding response OmpR family regulator